MKKFVVELLGTFLFVFTIGCVVVSGSPNPPLAIGATLMVLVYAGGHISGAHYNPAVSLGVLIRGRIAPGEMIQYWIAQIIGGLGGAIVSQVVTGNEAAVAMAPGTSVSLPMAVLAEVIGTFALTYVVLNVATAKGTAGNSFYGLAIGFTVFAMAVALGGISGGAFNPAVGLGRAFADSIVGSGNSLSSCWIYVLGPLAGSGLAGLVFNFLNPEDR